jgi:two-component system, LytTR family, response regulator LytT
MIKIIIIEDEKYTAQDLSETLQGINNEVKIVNILRTVQQAKEYFELNPTYDLIFSDIQLPDGLSFDIFKDIKISAPVIFCTAYDKYALNAFETNAIDYILKPFNKETISKALDKYEILKSRFSESGAKMEMILKSLGQNWEKTQTSIIIHQGDKIFPVEIKKIALFFLNEGYVFAVMFDSKKHLVTHTLEELEKKCDSSFFRVNRQYLVNRKAIRDVSRYFNRKLLINLSIDFNEQILIGKLKTSSFIKWLEHY